MMGDIFLHHGRIIHGRASPHVPEQLSHMVIVFVVHRRCFLILFTSDQTRIIPIERVFVSQSNANFPIQIEPLSKVKLLRVIIDPIAIAITKFNTILE